MFNFLIGTAIYNLLNSLAVLPLTRFLLKRQLREIVVTSEGSSTAPALEQTTRLAKQSFLYASLMVMTLAGMIMGLTGHPFIGLSLSRRGWPAMLAFCVTSFVFAAIRGAL